jgi:KipI family sensor histidine kinase inhibitor
VTVARGSGAVRPVHRLGDTAVVAGTTSVTDAHALAAGLTGGGRRPGVEDVVVGYRSVTVVADPTVADMGALAEDLARLRVGRAGVGGGARSGGRVVEVPVAFDGPDLDEVGARSGLTPAEVVRLLAATPFTVAFLGFLPGFAYLEGLPPALAAVPRRSTPRAAVGAGSVALGGGFAGIYPQASPGGWQVVGRTGMALFDPDRPPFALLRPGDVVRLCVVDDPGTVSGRRRPPLRPPRGAPAVVVEEPGLLSTVQDRGRVGVAGLGVPRAGAADPFRLRAANRLVGNDDGAAAIEVTATGPGLRFTGAAHVAVPGPVAASLDGWPVPPDTVVPVTAGQVLSVGTTGSDLRAYVAVAGGVDIPAVLGSRSSDVLTGLGPGPLRRGDAFGIGAPSRPRGSLARVAWEQGGRGGPPVARVLRVMVGPDQLGPDQWDRLVTRSWVVAAASDRVGVRLGTDSEAGTGPPLEPPAPGVASRAVVTGAVQVPPDGMPVALLCDHATVGGYPVVATVVSADVGVLGRCRPGDAVRFEPVDAPGAARARAAAEQALDRAVAGWYPVRTD